jgi:dephospho-CoA kinase
MEDQFDAVIVISADRKLRAKRLMDRDNVTRREAEELINVQMPDKEKVERARFVVLNNGSKNQLIKSVDLLHKNIAKISKKELKSLDSEKIMI